jgi:uncharacterized membrane protein YuzA (DUF378 family)
MLLLVVVVAFWLFVDVLGGLIVPRFGGLSASGLAISLLGLVIFSLVATLDGKNARLMQMLTAMIGCGALFGFVLTLVLAVALRFQEMPPIQLLALLSVWSVTLFSVIVDGHILSRTLERPRIHGVIAAFLIFALQFYLSAAFNPTPAAAA